MDEECLQSYSLILGSEQLSEKQGSIFTNYSQEYNSVSFFTNIFKLECNTTSDWLNRWFIQSEVVLHSNAA